MFIHEALAARALYWQKLLLAISEGRQTDISILLGIDVFQFFTRLQAYNDRIAAQLDAMKA